MIVSWIFRIGALLLGIPALVGLFEVLFVVFVGVHVVQQTPDYPWIDIQKYGIAGMVWNSGEFIAVMLKMLAGIGLFIAVLFAIALIFGILFAILYFVTGVGVARQRDWARVIGIVLAAFSLLFWLGGLNSGHAPDIATSAIGAAVAGYTIWALGWRYV